MVEVFLDTWPAVTGPKLYRRETQAVMHGDLLPQPKNPPPFEERPTFTRSEVLRPRDYCSIVDSSSMG